MLLTFTTVTSLILVILGVKIIPIYPLITILILLVASYIFKFCNYHILLIGYTGLNKELSWNKIDLDKAIHTLRKQSNENL